MIDTISALTFRRFVAGDVVQLALQDSQRVELGLEQPLDLDYGRELDLYGPAWTAVTACGRVLVCAGFRETFPPVQAVAWALLAEPLGIYHLAISRYARLRVEESGYRRIEAVAAEADRKACRWCELVGLHAAHRLEAFGAASEPHILFERIGA